MIIRSNLLITIALTIACRSIPESQPSDTAGHNLEDTANDSPDSADTTDSGTLDKGYTCHLLVGWDLNEIYPDGYPTVRLSYEAGATTAEAEDGDDWQQDFKMVQAEEGGSIITIVTFPIYATSPSPVLPGYTVRFQFDGDIDDARNGNEVPSETNEGTLGSMHASWRYANQDGTEILEVFDLNVSTHEHDGQYFNEVTLPLCELE